MKEFSKKNGVESNPKHRDAVLRQRDAFLEII
jgi:hypothetical protein